MQKYYEINGGGHNIRAKLYAADLSGVDTAVIFFTGFAGHKDNTFAEKLAGRMISRHKNVALTVFNWPAHADDVKRKISLADCVEYATAVISYVKNTLGAKRLFAFGISFGGYMILDYISTLGNPFEKIVLRCPAVNMYDSLTGVIMTKEDAELIKKGKSARVGFDRKVEITPAFLTELKENDVRKREFLDFADLMMMIHGTSDEVIPYDEARRFAENNVIELVTVNGADHRFKSQTDLEKAIKETLVFFGFEKPTETEKK